MGVRKEKDFEDLFCPAATATGNEKSVKAEFRFLPFSPDLLEKSGENPKFIRLDSSNFISKPRSKTIAMSPSF